MVASARDTLLRGHRTGYAPFHSLHGQLLGTHLLGNHRRHDRLDAASTEAGTRL